MEYLDLSQNALETVEGLEHLPNVTYVNLGSSSAVDHVTLFGFHVVAGG